MHFLTTSNIRIKSILFAFLVLVSSCTVEKRIYNKGYYLKWDHRHKVREEVSRVGNKEIKSDSKVSAQGTVVPAGEQRAADHSILSSPKKERKEIAHTKEEDIPEYFPEIKKEQICTYSNAGGETPADHDAEMAILWLCFTPLLSWISLILAIHYALKVKRENGKDGYPYSASANRKAELVFNILEILIILTVIFVGLTIYLLYGI